MQKGGEGGKQWAFKNQSSLGIKETSLNLSYSIRMGEPSHGKTNNVLNMWGHML